MNRFSGWTRIVLGAGNVLALLIATVAVAVRVGASGVGPGFALPASLDYSGVPAGEIAPLSAPYIAGILGEYSPADAIATLGGATRGGRAGARRAGVVDHPATNDDVAQAYPIKRVPFAGRTSTTAATRESQDPDTCSPTGGSVWYRYRPTQTQGLVASTAGSTYAIALGVFSGTIDRLSNIRCVTDARGAASLSFPAAAGVTYYVQITGPINGGKLVFTLAPAATTSLVSGGSDGASGPGGSDRPAVSADGRYVAFYGGAPNLDPRCPCGTQVYVRDVATGRTVLASESSDGTIGNHVSVEPDISADGRYVVFHSVASNLVPGDTNGLSDVFVRDMVARRTTRVSVTSSGGQANGFWSHISATGRYVVFASDAEELSGPRLRYRKDIYHHDRVTGKTTVVSVASDGTAANADSTFADLSPEGRFVIFWSRASNLVPGVTGPYDDAMNQVDTYHGHMFVHDLGTRTTTAECVAADGTPANDECPPGAALSLNARYSVFQSLATNLVPGQAAPSGTGQILQVFVRDRLSGRVELASVSSAGEPAGDPHQRAIPVVREGVVGVRWATISWDGRFVAFDSGAPDLVASDSNGKVDIFLRDRLLGRTTRISVGSADQEANDNCAFPSLSADGRVVAFSSDATNLTTGDRNGLRDVFARL